MLPQRAEEREVLGRRLPVAHLEDVLQGKVWAASDPSRRPSERQKDLADLARLLEVYLPVTSTGCSPLPSRTPGSPPATLGTSDTLDGGDVLPGFELPVGQIFED